MKTKWIKFFLLIVISTLIFSCVENKNGGTKRLVSKIDHILIEPEDPYGFFIFLTDELKLPVIWKYAKYENFMSGGIFCGNIKLEAISTDKVSADSAICGIAFDPELNTEKTLVEMKNRSISHGDPVNMKSYIRTKLNDLLPGSWIFFCEYFIDKETLEKMKKSKQNELDEKNGGPLGIENVLEVTIKVGNYSYLEKWGEIIPLKEYSDDKYIYVESSPNIKFIKSDKNSIISIKFKVRSLENVKEYLLKNNMLGFESDNVISSNPKNTFGVLFEFSEEANIY